ncbi:MAG: uroporphyrinogen-III C-methyltransferase [Thermodesulfobacteriota bacterium]
MTQTSLPPVPASGKVYLIGAGPGDPTLITVKGLQFLQKAQVVVYDYLASPKLLAHVPQGTELVYVGKKGGGLHAKTQEEINQILVDKAREGKRVVRLKGGDPFIFGRGGEEIEELVEAGVAFEVVPGVTSATAAATYAGVPITHRRYTASVAFITGHEEPGKAVSNVDWEKISTGIGTLVFYMGIKNLPHITEKLIANGRDPQTPVVVVRWASTPEQRSVEGTLETIADIVTREKIKPPALVVVGDVVRLRQTINWFEKRPLFGKRIMVTRTREQASDLVAGLEELGAECIEWPTIAIGDPDSWDVLDEAVGNLPSFHWILFTSINTIRCFFKRLYERGLDSRALGNLKVGVVGTTTADELKKHGIVADLVPAVFTGDGLAEAMVATGVAGCRILLPRAQKAREILPEVLTEAGAEVVIAPVYRNTRPQVETAQLREMLAERAVDIITFTSSSTVTNFLHMLGARDPEELRTLLAATRIAAIGPVTAKTAEQAGLTVDIQPETYTIPALIAAILQDSDRTP